MKFTCEKYLLQNAITTASRASSPKSPIQALEGLLIETGANVRITGYDLKKGIYTSFPADIFGTGSIILGAKLFGDIVRSLPDGPVTIETGKDNLTTITGGNAEFSIVGTSSDDYPELPSIDHQKTVTMEQRVLRKMIGETLFAVSDNEARPVYTGALFEKDGDRLAIITVDGYRLALRREKYLTADEDIGTFIVPGNTLSDVEKICEDSENPAKISVGAKHISFTIGDTVIISRRLEGEFLNYRRSIAENFTFSVVAERTELHRVATRVSLIIDEKTKNPLRCTVRDGEIFFSCITPLGKAEDICAVEGNGNDLEIGFNNRYLLDAVKAAPADKLRLYFSTGSTPCIIRPVDESDDSFLYMILPVRLRADN
jgi:DNA polymerase-3 subunit beta